jgi:hypothetical protein
MPGDPKECREHAANCRLLAEQSPLGRHHFLDLADSWERLAAELESAEVFLRTMGEIEGRPASDPSAERPPPTYSQKLSA